jgi:putative ABC transport system permease protein
VLVVLGALGVVLGAAATARERGETLARLRTLGLRRRAGRTVIAAELLPPAAVAALGGLLAGMVIARLSIGPLGLRLISGGSADPPLVVPWWTVLPALLVVAAVPVVVAVETSVRRGERLGLVARAGT